MTNKNKQGQTRQTTTNKDKKRQIKTNNEKQA